jgi:hypothetical protein
MTSAASLIIGLALILLAIFAPVLWAVRRILMPIDRAGDARKAPLRFSIGDFLCLFWIVQLPLAFVFRLDGEETQPHYWVLMALIWAVAPFVWFTCARALSKAGIVTGLHRFVFLGVVVPTVYYGLFPFIGLSLSGVVQLLSSGPDVLWEHSFATALWCVLATALLLGGFYSPWLERNQARLSATSDGDVQ